MQERDREPKTLKVLSHPVCANRAGIALRTWQRVLAVGEGPAVVHLTKRRRGVLEEDFERWLLSRRKAAPGDAGSSSIKKGEENA
jgi:hypothetical protein